VVVAVHHEATFARKGVGIGVGWVNGRRPEHGPPGDGLIRLGVMSGFDLEIDGSAIELPLNAQRLVAFLCLQERPAPRLYVSGALWTDSDEDRASASLRSSIWRVGQAAPGLIRASKTHMQIAPGVWIDLRESARIAAALIDGSACAVEVDYHALDGELLPGWYDDWVLVERERQRQLRLHALEALCLQLTSARKYARAIEAGMAAVRAEPLRESAQRALIAAHLAEGNCGEALHQFKSYERLLDKDLGLAPSEQMSELVSAITV
jgi:DNA-binding SARP family transcriptional activator